MMRIVLSVLALIAVSQALPQLGQCNCDTDYTPMCGKDHRTYPNRCEMDCNGAELMHEGACIIPCICTMQYQPTCGQDGVTYSNPCQMNCAGVALFQAGPCTATRIDAIHTVQKRQVGGHLCACPFIYRPVCGSNGLTYGNECSMHCVEGVTMAHMGDC